ncbi:hypothetical protein DPMN_054100 [Dreissena polymorpha]|uniref:Uncharacterized protein n=1 Tax=Dreissena polymorpha TaxID=45954 RepID=A0A9D4CPP5_DREPO|nr:hypothetical protein DPMN_054100 [Dreissena polymorpha]
MYNATKEGADAFNEPSGFREATGFGFREATGFGFLEPIDFVKVLSSNVHSTRNRNSAARAAPFEAYSQRKYPTAPEYCSCEYCAFLFRCDPVSIRKRTPRLREATGYRLLEATGFREATGCSSPQGLM